MSFSEKTKTELCRAPLGRSCCQLAEVYGVLLYAAVFTHREIRITTELQAFARRAALLLEKVFGVAVAPVVSPPPGAAHYRRAQPAHDYDAARL